MKICENETCGRLFVPTEDQRQKYCCNPCAKAQMSRRKNRRRRLAEERAIQQITRAHEKHRF